MDISYAWCSLLCVIVSIVFAVWICFLAPKVEPKGVQPEGSNGIGSQRDQKGYTMEIQSRLKGAPGQFKGNYKNSKDTQGELMGQYVFTVFTNS